MFFFESNNYEEVDVYYIKKFKFGMMDLYSSYINFFWYYWGGVVSFLV